MKLVLIGHRGVGKTSLLQRLSTYQTLRGQSTPVYDLDREIELDTGLSIQEIFETRGEIQFREMELKKFQEVTSKSTFIISVGAGFLMKKIKNEDPKFFEQLEIVWVRRPSDANGRIFLDRPRLNAEVQPLEEYHSRYEARTKLFHELCTWIYDLPEGLNALSHNEQLLFFGQINELGGGITVLPEHASNYESFKIRQWRWDADFFELRDDLLNDSQLEKFFVLLAPSQTLISFRKRNPSPLFLQALEEGYRTDWPLEMPSPLSVSAAILSVHTRGPEESVQQVIERLERVAKPHQNLKLAIAIQDFSELETGLQWQAKEPSRRSFLPNSVDGRWAWARLWLKDRQALNFIREGEGISLDQPTLSQWMASPARPTRFAAIVGDPVAHSFSPSEHADFFHRRLMPYFAVLIPAQEWEKAFSLLEKLGLVAISVTAPLKGKAFANAQRNTELATELGSVNTLCKAGSEWVGHNTDYAGFEFVLSTISDLGTCVFWGGGGTLPVLKALLPEAQSYSVRTGAPREALSQEIPPQTLIWAAGPDRESPLERSHGEWKPKTVIDLNYREDSRAKQYCQSVGARYISGLPMFKAQAQAQREFWHQAWAEGPHASK
jgi:shikimate 5-dehydrogenase/shikimate kinase